MITPSFHLSHILKSCPWFIKGRINTQKRHANCLEFAYLFEPTIRESLKQLTDIGFVYYTSPHSVIMKYWDEMKLPFRELPSLSVPLSVEMAKDDQRWKTGSSTNLPKPKYQRQCRHSSIVCILNARSSTTRLLDFFITDNLASICCVEEHRDSAWIL